jgi:hypothetical protein
MTTVATWILVMQIIISGQPDQWFVLDSGLTFDDCISAMFNTGQVTYVDDHQLIASAKLSCEVE